MKRAANGQAYAIGHPSRNGFRVRRVVWGKLMASYELRAGEEIRRAIISVAPNKSRPVTKERHESPRYGGP